METYKLRAECSHDLAQFIYNAHNHLGSFEMKQDSKLPDVEFTFQSKLSSEELIEKLREIEDSHVMFQTLSLIEKYTGERNYDL